VLIPLTCPGCGNIRQINESFAGRTVRCPKCSEYCEVPPAEAGPLASAGVAPRRRRRVADLDDEEHTDFEMEQDGGRWRVVSAGLLGMQVADGLLILALGGLVAAVLIVLGSNPLEGTRHRDITIANSIMLGVVIGSGVAIVVQLVGLVLCCLVPRNAGARGRASLALLLYLMGLVLPVGALVAWVALSGYAAEEPMIPVVLFWVAVAGGVIWFLSHLLAILFLADVAFYFGRKGVAKSAFVHAALLFLGIVVGIAALFLASSVDVGALFIETTAPRPGARPAVAAGPTSRNYVSTAMIVQIVSVVLLAVAIFWHVLLLGSVRRIIRKELRVAREAASE
jgi:hypothetical protein